MTERKIEIGGGPRVDACILYWGVEGAGKTTNLRTIHAKLRPDHRGRLREMPTELDPGVCYEVLPIELGEVSGVRTRLSIVTVPDGAAQAPTRKRLLDRVDGIVFVVDGRPDRMDANLASFEELRSALSDYGRGIGDLPLVVQYNHRDEAELSVLESLHRKLDLRGVPVFEAVATRGTGVLPTLTTISKRVVRARRERVASEAREARPAAAAKARATATTVQPEPAPRAMPVIEPADALVVEAPASVASVAPAAATLSAPVADPAPAAARSARAQEPAPGPGSVRGLFDASFRAMTAELHAQAVDAPLAAPAPRELAIASIGTARLRSPRALEIPLVLVDAEGRESRVLLGVSLDPLLDPPPGGAAPP